MRPTAWKSFKRLVNDRKKLVKIKRKLEVHTREIFEKVRQIIVETNMYKKLFFAKWDQQLGNLSNFILALLELVYFGLILIDFKDIDYVFFFD